MAKDTVKDVGDTIGSAVRRAWHEAARPADESSPKRSKGPLSGLRGVAIGAGLGVLAAKKGGPLLKDALMKYVTSHATGQASPG